MRLLILLAFTLITSAATASWKKIIIPDTKCGSGAPYHIFYKAGDPQKLNIHLMGGGACWSKKTCIGRNAKTILFALPRVPEVGGILNRLSSLNPLAKHTKIYFPYCTGDVFAGNHIAIYEDRKVYHFGKQNFENTLAYLKNLNLIQEDNLDELVIYGASAGALGGLLQLPLIDSHFQSVPRKVLIADAPGLHFGPTFWDKFTSELINDYSQAMESIDLSFDKNVGNLSPQILNVCRKFSNWEIAILQGSRDLVMSNSFGEITPKEHEKLLYGPTGLFNVTKDTGDNCSAWTPKSYLHTFLLTDLTAQARTSDRTSALDYIFSVIQFKADKNHK